MADPDKIPETQSDTQITYDPTAEESTRIMESSVLSESQDFHLVDCGDSQNETQEATRAIISKDQMEIPTEIVADASNENSAQSELLFDTKLPEKSIIEKKDNSENKKKTENTKNLSNNDDNDNDDDDDDFVQSSQLESLSPLKKQLSNLTCAISQKRKADETDEPSAKYPRTCSREDALTNVRKRLDVSDEAFDNDETMKTTSDDDKTRIIIAETQETSENAIATESLQQVEQELEEALSQHPLDEQDTRMANIVKTLESSPIKVDTTEERVMEENESSDIKIAVELKMQTEKLISEVAKDPETIIKSVDTTVEEIAEIEKNEESTMEIVQSTSIIDDTKEKSTENLVEAISPKKSDESAIVKEQIVSQNSNKETSTVTSTSRSRMSIEVIYDRATAPPEKKLPRELVEIDEDGEKIILDSSQESCDKIMEKSIDNKIIADTSYKTCISSDYKSIDNGKDTSNDFKSSYSLTNGSTDTKTNDSDHTITAKSDLLSDTSIEKNITSLVQQSPSKKSRINKIMENPEIIISDSEGESFVVEERTKIKDQTPTSVNHNDSTTKMIPIEKELSIIVKLKCLIYIDETTKEQVEKIVTGVHCESTVTDFSSSRRRNSDTSACLADISGNEKEASPGSVTSNAQPYPLNPRLSMVSMASSSSNSSAGSLNARILANKMFQLPRVPAKHAKKVLIDTAITEKRNEIDESLEQLRKEWKNVDSVTTTLMNYASNELSTMDLHNGSTERVDNSLERIRSSTPEIEAKNETPVVAQSATPKRSAKRNRTIKATRSKTIRSEDNNEIVKNSPTKEIDKSPPSTSRKRKSSPDTSTTSRQSTNTKDSLNENNDELVGKEVFAKWSDNKYYPGTVTGKTKTKFKVNFYDGQNKMIIEDFIVPMPATLTPGLSVYATSDDDDYGSCGIILDVKKQKDNAVAYVVETDEHEKIEVDIKNIFLTNDQVQVLKEETKNDHKTPPSTPKHLGKVTLDNVVDGKRRSKRILTPVATTPKGKRGRTSLIDKIVDTSKPSASGIASSSTKIEDNNETTSDSNYSGNEDDLMGVQAEIIGTPNEQEDTKGPQSILKGRARSRKRSDNPEIIAYLGPVPSQNSDIFRNMSFILTCASLDSIERYQAVDSSRDTKDSSSDPGTENEEEWTRKPFVRDRLIAQLTAGGGKIYDKFELIPSEEYARTMHITNVPNTTKKSLLCLSVGIKTYNHQWVIRCCQENKVVNPSEEELPAGWSILKRSYIDMFQRRNEKPFQTLPVIVVMPVTPANKEFVSFWRQICENAGSAVLLVKSPDDTFIEGTVVLTNKHCPSWVIERASSWGIPLVSTVWIIECLIEGNICNDDAHPSFKYNYVKKSSSHISHLKRR